jgi:hypothetical protein
MPSPSLISCVLVSTIEDIYEDEGVTNSFSNSRDSQLSGQDAHILSVLDQSVVSTTSEVRERLYCRDVRDIEQSLTESRDIGNDIGWINTLKHVVGQESSDCDAVVAVFDSRSFGGGSVYICKGLVRWCHNGDVGRRGERVCEAVHETDKLKQRTEIRLRREERSNVSLSQAESSHQDGRPK